MEPVAGVSKGDDQAILKHRMADEVNNSRKLELKINSDPANLAPVRTEVEALARENDFEDRAVDEIGLVLNEALANVIRHAYKNSDDRPIELSAECVQGELIIRIRDWGSGVDPSERMPRRKDPNTPGGLGLICMRQLMDEVEFHPQRDGMLLIMKRRR